MLIENVVGGKYNRNVLVEVPDIFAVDVWGQQAGEQYYSVYNLHPYVHDHLRVKGKLKGYKGPVAAPYLWWDIDEDQIEIAYNSTLELFRRLLSQYQCNLSNIKVFFSGKKGFHLMYYSPAMELKGFDPMLPRMVRVVCDKISVGINTDEKVYNKNRIFRVINSFHPEGEKYKVDVTDLFYNDTGIDAMLDRASDQYQTIYGEMSTVEVPGIIDLLVEAEADAKANPNVSSAGSATIQDLIEMFNNGVQDGSRNDSLTRVAGFLHRKSMDYEAMHAMVDMVNRQSPTPLPDGDVETICESVEQYDVTVPYNEISITKISTIKSAGQKWFDMFAQNGYTNYGPRFPHLTRTMEMCIPGDVILIVASSGVGKTLTGIQIANEDVKANGGRVLFFSLEMSDEGIFFRIAIQESPQLADDNGFVRPKLVASALHRDPELRQRIDDECQQLLIVDSIDNLHEATQYIALAIEELENHGEKLTAVVCDYGQMLGGMEDGKLGPKIARSIKSIAKNYMVRFYMLLQTNKTFSGGRPTLNQIEGTGGWRQTADYAMVLWSHSSLTNIIHAAFDKNRWGMPEEEFAFIKHGLKLSSIDAVPEDENPLEKNGEY
jgi:hypothetical protein